MNFLLTLQCSNNCSFCFMPRNDVTHMSVTDFIRYFQHSLRLGQRNIGILGGEPMMSPNFIPIIDFLVENRFYYEQFRLFSNMTCSDVCRQLADVSMSATSGFNFLVWNNACLYKKDRRFVDEVHANVSALTQGIFAKTFRISMSLTLTLATTVDDLAYLSVCRDLFGINNIRFALDVGTHDKFSAGQILTILAYLKKEGFDVEGDFCGFVPLSLFNDDERRRLAEFNVHNLCLGFCGDVTPAGKLIPCMPFLFKDDAIDFLSVDSWASAILRHRGFPFAEPCKKGIKT